MKFSKKWDIYRQFNGLCYYCGNKITRIESTIDHVKPLSQGGSKLRNNLVLSCKRCNHNKGDINVIIFLKGYNCNSEHSPSYKRALRKKEILMSLNK